MVDLGKYKLLRMALDQSDFRALLHRFQAGECTVAEKRRVEQWYRGLGAERDWALTADEQASLVEAVWRRIAAETSTAPFAGYGAAAGGDETADDRAHRPSWWRAGRRWAAAAVLVGGLTLLGTYATRPGGPGVAPPAEATEPGWLVRTNTTAADTRVALPDGSAVTLAPASSLKYPRAFGGARRAVYLRGAAFFTVFHDAAHPFSVYTDRVVTTVLGTSFRVQAYAGQPEVQVQVRTGRVRVSPRAAAGNDARSLVVLPNQQAVYSAPRGQLRRELMARPAQLAAQSFTFDDRPVAEVLAALEQAYGVPIVSDAAAGRGCTVTLHLGEEPLFAKLGVLCETLGATYEQADGHIVFHCPPCQAE